MPYDRNDDDDLRYRNRGGAFGRNSDDFGDRESGFGRDRDSRFDRDRDRSYGFDRDGDRDGGLFRGGRDDRDSATRGRDRDDRHFGRDDNSSGVPIDETRDLIASNKVEGTPVYGRDDEKLGSVKTLMIDKYRGQVRYAVISHSSGFLGLDEQYVPVKWDELRYDERRGGYRIDYTERDVRFTLENRRRDQNRTRDRESDRYRF